MEGPKRVYRRIVMNGGRCLECKEWRGSKIHQAHMRARESGEVPEVYKAVLDRYFRLKGDAR